jgi:hypothetical protein
VHHAFGERHERGFFDDGADRRSRRLANTAARNCAAEPRPGFHLCIEDHGELADLRSRTDHSYVIARIRDDAATALLGEDSAVGAETKVVGRPHGDARHVIPRGVGQIERVGRGILGGGGWPGVSASELAPVASLSPPR